MKANPNQRDGGESSTASVPQSFSLALYLVNHFCLAVLLLVVLHYIMIFFVETSRSMMNLMFMAIVFPFGYDNFCRMKSGLGMSLVFGLGIGMTAVLGMSFILWLILDEPFFGSSRARQDLTESTVAIMLSYGCGSALAKFVYQAVPKETRNGISLATTLRTIFSAIGAGEGKPTVNYIKAIEMIIRALEVLVVAVGALIFAIKGLLR